MAANRQPPAVVARTATEADLGRLTDILASSFFDDPTWGPLLGEGDRRRRAMQSLLGFFASSALRFPWVLLSGADESAAVDGAGATRRFWHITLPGLKHVIIVTTLLSFILTINDFNIVYVMTRGGPGTATQIFATYSYEVAFNQLRWGRGVTISIFLVPLLVLGIALISRYLLREPR
jgi:hypothetical protein